MSLILSIETTTTNCSVAISKEGKTVVLKEDNGAGYSHAESLHVFIDEVIKSAEITSSQLDAIAISKGPGSYTGLRIGVSAAKGLCFSLDKPLISVSTLEALSRQVQTDEGMIVPMLDARRLEVYSAILDKDHQVVREVQAEILNADSYAEYLEKGPVYFVGNGVAKTKELISHPNAVFVEGKLPSAKEMGALAHDKLKKNDIEDVAYFEPFYLKDFIALKPKS
ncbi:tRNA (adenosine(37)-N6)-threonylcarbamoyltransferase complex dimerization subunit type 1 TsaB [Mangrovimonas sp. TPBH4]|uniref:tRNA (adenosine(37)-N6)-threonylcarbamoyltransferase complex dimerization subunit type 1 TsaB n=1 Tax=Mangrovimonas sp. TPBH4 TaxID=1645914 RepID=UPI0006B53FB5|nr:tRNA (adenosine(37)-N6)-threonylcarbamoyltransferase complex dimerization subunit type 1 TsaB [Mangrovimonas sp. TPBH4]